MAYKQLAILSVSFICLSAWGFTRSPSLPEDFPPWQVRISTPSFYPVKVGRSYGINEAQDWTSLMHNDTSAAAMAASRLSNIRALLPDYDGFALPLGSGNRRLPQIAAMRDLPDSIYVYWTSLFDQRFFVTQLKLSKEIKTKMLARQQFLYNKNVSCFENEVVFGLLPNGQAKVWLSGCGTYTFIDEIAPVKESDKSIDGRDAASYRKGWEYQDILERAKSENATIDPIPWDRVNQVVTYIRSDFR